MELPHALRGQSTGMQRRIALACFGLIALLQACSQPKPSVWPSSGNAVVYVIQRDWHTDIGLAVEDITGPLATVEKSFPGVRFVTFGFGERQFLTGHRTDFGAMLSALLPSQSALLMTALKATPEQAFGPDVVVALRISRSGQRQIEDAIWRELELSPSGHPTTLAEGPYPGSVFFAARDTYDGFYTCNTWTADTLHVGGLPVPATGVLFSGQVMSAARWIGKRQSSPATAADLSGEFSSDDRRTLGE